MTEWQPIETVPFGTFLVWLESPHRSMGTCVSIMRNEPNAQFINGLFAWDLPLPTHWMPLPEPPQ